jgi:hypothetical protein
VVIGSFSISCHAHIGTRFPVDASLYQFILLPENSSPLE